MYYYIADRVQETTLTTGTGTVTLAGAVLGFQTFAVIGNGNSTFYTIADQGGSNWEVGIGTYTSSGTTLSRDTVLASSNGGSLVNFSAGTKTAFVTYPSEKSVNLDIAGNVNIPNQLVIENTALTTSNTSNLVVGGPLSFTDTGIASNFVGDTDNYYQATIQNLSNGAAATAEFIAYNDNGSSTDNYAAMGINSSGFMYRSTSSLKYKKNVQDATHGLAEVLQLRPVTYESKQEAEAGNVYGGLIAEEVHEAGLTEFVQYAEDGKTIIIDGNTFVPNYEKAPSEIRAKIDALGGLAAVQPYEEPKILASQIKSEAGIRLSKTDWYVIRAMEQNESVPEKVLAERALIREKSNELEKMNPIPLDYQNDKYWR